jgi:protein-S-isoprenylcysteine O-methyltransferase Ste14
MLHFFRKHDDSPRVWVHPPILFGGGLLIGLALDHWLGLSFGVGAAVKLGYLFLFGGLALAVWSVWQLRIAGTNVPTNLPVTALVETGPYRASRNPIYIALTVAYLGLVSLLDAPLALAALLPILFVLHFGVVLPEERYLEAKFGAGYRAYAARTRRYV